MLYRNKELNISSKLIDEYLFTVHAGIEKYFCDCSMHRVFGIDVTKDDDLTDFSAFDITEAVEKCMKEDIDAVRLRKECHD